MIADTSVVFGDLDLSDDDHVACKGLLDRLSAPAVVVAPAIVEICQLIIGRELGPAREAAFLREVDNDYQIENPTDGDILRAADLVAQYSDQDGGEGIGYVDAVTVAIAERLNERTIATLDQHFTIVRPQHVDRFEVLPGPVSGRRRGRKDRRRRQ